MMIMLLVALAGLVAGFSFIMIEITCRVETLENAILLKKNNNGEKNE